MIDEINRIGECISVEVGIATAKEHRIGGVPSPEFGVIVSGAEADQARIGIVMASSETEALVPRIGVGEDSSLGVVVYSLKNLPGVDINREANTSHGILGCSSSHLSVGANAPF